LILLLDKYIRRY